MRTRSIGLRLALPLAVLTACRDRPALDGAPLSAAGLLSAGETTGYARAMAPRPFAFPADHGPHPEFRTEWWYFTGTLAAGVADAGRPSRRFGYQLTVFRQALAPSVPPRPSRWATRDVYMAHLAVTDVEGRRFASFQRLARAGNELAGARAAPFAAWVEDWQMRGPERGGTFPVTLEARGTPEGKRDDSRPAAAIALTIGEGRGPILQGDRGLSQKGPEPGNASYYYSHTRLPTRGRIEIGGETFEVEGHSWLDREWSTSALSPGVAGWDWLSLHLGDGRDLMVFRLRRRDGGSAAESRATIIEADGRTRLFTPDEFTLAPRGAWTSPRSGAAYPASFELQIPSVGISLAITPWIAGQELDLAVRYWEGAVAARGTRGNATLEGEGYLELTGYAERR